MLKYNLAKQRMLEGKPAIGAAATLGVLGAEALARAGFHYILVDDQHSLWQPEQIVHAFQVIRLAGGVPMARVQKNDFGQIGAMLDRGALGIIVPMVNTVEQAQAAAFACRYPPRGGRSEGAYNVSMYGPEYSKRIDDEVFLAVQIETAEAAERAEEILSVDGVDGCWIGPADLARSMGLQHGAPEAEPAIQHVLDVCKRIGKIAGIACVGKGLPRMKQGFLFVTPASDYAFVVNGAAAMLQQFAAEGFLH
jgi:4-hydroxy-2-oxoheptanedioate aldolase